MDLRARKYSERLGVISDAQFQRALDTFGLGRFLGAEPISQGLFGQNVYVTSSGGEFVLRGKPHYDWQFPNEKLFADLLHAHTRVPVPHPYLLDPDPAIFGWPYVIMPRLAGRDLSDDVDETLRDADRLEIAVAQGRLLAEAQRLTHAFCGKFDVASGGIRPYEGDWFPVFARQTMELLRRAASYNGNTPDRDLEWATGLIAAAQAAMDDFRPTFFMQDYKPGNMVADVVDGRWQITGLFDLMEASFGHPEADLSRLWAVYVEKGRDDLAYAFLNAYLPAAVDVERFARRVPLFMLHDRALIWEWVQRTNRAWWDTSWTFRVWAERFLRMDRRRLAGGSPPGA